MALDEEYALTIHEAGKDSVVYLRPLSDEEKRSQLWHMNDVRREPCVCLKLWGKRGGGIEPVAVWFTLSWDKERWFFGGGGAWVLRGVLRFVALWPPLPNSLYLYQYFCCPV